jgi:gamma-glutamyltranspeptidase/glutathione hydrolase
MNHLYHRREALRIGCGALLGTTAAAVRGQAPEARRGRVVGQLEGARAGEEVLAAGGNAVDAAVAAALVAGVVAIHQCGPGGYGGHMVIAPAGGKITAIDFNSTAPAAARPDMFPLDAQGQVPGKVNEIGWLAAGVPGTLAGLQLALDRFGSQPLRKVIQPALRYTRDGFPITAASSGRIRQLRKPLSTQPALAAMLMPGGEPLKEGSTFRNPDLARMLETLAEKNSVEPFYRGPIAERIAAAFRKNGGLVTLEDLANYRAREVEPLTLSWKGSTIHTAPLTAGGLSALEALAILRELHWDEMPPAAPRTLHAQVDALRLAWHDRLRLLGDPDKARVDWQPLLAQDYVRRRAGRLAQAVEDRKPVTAATDGRKAGGTIHLSAADSQGTMVALTLTHGNSFGSMALVEGLGLILGQGMSRFDPHPDHPNAPGPGKRPLHNMCPTIVTRDGQPVFALGGAGGRMIPNAVFNVLALAVGRGVPFADAVAAPRPHTEGGLDVKLEPKYAGADADYLKKIGFQVTRGPHALVNAVARDAKSGTIAVASR